MISVQASTLIGAETSFAPQHGIQARSQLGQNRRRSTLTASRTPERWGDRLASLWIAEDFGGARFRLMVKRGPR